MTPGPVDLSEDEIRAASAGRAEEVLANKKPIDAPTGQPQQAAEEARPVDLSEDEIRAASAGRAEEVMANKKPIDAPARKSS